MNTLNSVTLNQIDNIAARVSELKIQNKRHENVMANSADHIENMEAVIGLHKNMAELQRLQREVLDLVGF